MGAAHAAGLSTIALTDHDVLSGLAEAESAGLSRGVQVIAGIEMTAARLQGRRAVHLLGYWVDREDAALLAALARARRLMETHVDTVLAAIGALGIRLERSHLEGYRHRYAGGAALVFGMLQRGVLRGLPAGTGMRLLRMAADEPRAYTLREAVDLVHGAGGIVSLAHPAKLRRGEPLQTAAELRAYAECGLDALEAWQWIPHGWGSEHYRRVADELGLLVTGGSDDHGKRDAEGRSRLGRQPVTAAVLEPLSERASVWRARRAPRSA